MRYIDLFCGIGGFRTALDSLGHECVFSNDLDKYAASIYRYHWNDITEGDIKEIETRDIPDFDLLCAGSPCQDFSVAGVGRGLEGTRGTLLYEVARILNNKRPRYFLFENVAGLLSNKSGETFQEVLRLFTYIGYRVQWQLLDSKEFGVPQQRNRVFIVGHLRGERRPEVFPFLSTDGENTKNIQRQTSTCLDANYWKGWLDHGQRTFIVNSEEGITDTNSMIVRRAPLRFLTRNQKNIEGDYAFTVDSHNTGGVLVGAKIRKFTPRECERLQGFPDDHTLKGLTQDGKVVDISDTRRYMALGNSVTVPVIKRIGERLGCGV